jgi:hypothetical protein
MILIVNTFRPCILCILIARILYYWLALPNVIFVLRFVLNLSTVVVVKFISLYRVNWLLLLYLLFWLPLLLELCRWLPVFKVLEDDTLLSVLYYFLIRSSLCNGTLFSIFRLFFLEIRIVSTFQLLWLIYLIIKAYFVKWFEVYTKRDWVLMMMIFFLSLYNFGKILYLIILSGGIACLRIWFFGGFSRTLFTFLNHLWILMKKNILNTRYKLRTQLINSDNLFHKIPWWRMRASDNFMCQRQSLVPYLEVRQHYGWAAHPQALRIQRWGLR